MKEVTTCLLQHKILFWGSWLRHCQVAQKSLHLHQVGQLIQEDICQECTELQPRGKSKQREVRTREPEQGYVSGELCMCTGQAAQRAQGLWGTGRATHGSPKQCTAALTPLSSRKPTLRSWLLLKPSKWYLCWHSGLSKRLRRASHTCPSSLVIFNWSSGGTTCHVPFSNFLNLPEGQKNTGLQGETELRQETGLRGWVLPFICFLTQTQASPSVSAFPNGTAAFLVQRKHFREHKKH